MGYSFGKQYRTGNEAERFIYEVFQGRFSVIPAPGYLQDQGVDFTFTDLVNGQSHRVELKTDTRAHRTGNAFIETVSIERDGAIEKQGWAYTSIADYLLYFVPGMMPRVVYRVSMEDLRQQLPRWVERCQERRIPNEDTRRGNYFTVGILVPLAEMQAIAREVIEL